MGNQTTMLKSSTAYIGVGNGYCLKINTLHLKQIFKDEHMSYSSSDSLVISIDKASLANSNVKR